MAKAAVSVENLDFEHLDDQELREVMQRAKDALTARFTSRIQEFREAAREAGFTVTLTKLGKETPRRGVSPKYHNPDNPAETWAGRGRKPKWVAGKLATGSSLDDLLINREASLESAAATDSL